MCKIEMAHCWLSKRSTTCSPGCAISLPTAPMPAISSSRRSPNSAIGASRSCGAWPIPSALRSCHAAGSSNARWLGSIATAALPRTSKPPSPAPRLGSMSPPCSYSSGVLRASNSTYPIKIRTLRLALPDERDPRRLAAPETDWDRLQGLIVEFRRGDAPVARAYLGRAAADREGRILDLVEVWAAELADPELKREAALI